MPNSMPVVSRSFDRTNAVLAGLVFVAAFVVYSLTVQRSLSFWDCGEFIACSYTLGIPHPPGTPLYILLGRVFSLIPIVGDISWRVNYLSVLSSSFTAMFSYLLAVRLTRHFSDQREDHRLGRYIAYIGGVAGGLFVAFSYTNWTNSVEAEPRAVAVAFAVAIVWMALRYFDQRGTLRATRTMVLAMYLALLAIGVHMTVFLVVPVCAIFFVLKREAEGKHYLAICGFAILELLMVTLFANGRGGFPVFLSLTALLTVVLLVLLYRKINWGILIAIGSAFPIMLSYNQYLKLGLPLGLAAMIALAFLCRWKGWKLQWKTGLVIILLSFIGLSVHLYVPIRSAHNPRIDENNPSRDFRTLIDFFDRRQYGQQSMAERMFHRRGAWENQLGRHANIGFWSYFEIQYSSGRWVFVPFLLLGLIGLYVAISKRLELGMPYLTLFLLASLGLVLYMNFADGTRYDVATNDAYLEVRNRDYFFTPAFVFFGVAMGMGLSAVIRYLRDQLAGRNRSRQRTVVYACAVLALLPAISLANNYHSRDRSKNFIPYNYSFNILNSCPPNAILFTSGDNDTFPVWCVQEVYNYRKDVRVVNLSLLNTDWYVEQMKNRYNVPMSLTDEQILWYPVTIRGREVSLPRKRFHDRPRGRYTYLQRIEGARVQDMMVDEIVLENKWKDPICFSSLPYAESPLKLRDYSVLRGLVYILKPPPVDTLIDAETGYDLYMNTYRFDGYANSDVYRDENTSGVFQAVGVSAVRIHDELLLQGDTTRAVAVLERMVDAYPEYWQTGITLADFAYVTGDTARGDSLFWMLHDTLEAFRASNRESLFYLQDLGLVKAELGRRKGDEQMVQDGLQLMWEAFRGNLNSAIAFRKLVTALSQNRRYAEMQQAARLFSEYKINLTDPILRQLLGTAAPPGNPRPGG
ncbi:MAG TPA: DUF2723 domain-containing protein [Acidobacteriota bacterium]|nr:DUF2723 domain-containing protein [Acidobacteriota bacterium]